MKQAIGITANSETKDQEIPARPASRIVSGHGGKEPIGGKLVGHLEVLLACSQDLPRGEVRNAFRRTTDVTQGLGNRFHSAALAHTHGNFLLSATRCS